ncbi:MAG: YggS family pyridoxal phosphate-dependent enzyme [Bacteroidales bacterium]|nr:YggS family pyridoxal phosphate-dependent enzyme [Bacteroidales bacterium]
MESVQNIINLKKQVPDNVKIVAVSKTQPAEEILKVYGTGHKIFGENRVQELLFKKERLPSDIEWHFIGHLQTNKVRSLLPHVVMIHSADSYRLITVINREAEKLNLMVKCLIQFHIAREETKAGFSLDEAEAMLQSADFIKIKNIVFCGVMGMATLTDDMNMVRNEFRTLREYFTILRDKYFSRNPEFREISMGMSGDYAIAVEEGSTIIRVGTLIFGERKNQV